jgi:hypothetical protein
MWQLRAWLCRLALYDVDAKGAFSFSFPSSSLVTSTMWHLVLAMTYLQSLFSSFILATFHLIMYHEGLTFIDMSSSQLSSHVHIWQNGSLSSGIIFVIASHYEDVQVYLCLALLLDPLYRKVQLDAMTYSWNHLAPPPPPPPHTHTHTHIFPEYAFSCLFSSPPPESFNSSLSCLPLYSLEYIFIPLFFFDIFFSSQLLPWPHFLLVAHPPISSLSKLCPFLMLHDVTSQKAVSVFLIISFLYLILDIWHDILLSVVICFAR